MSKKETMTTLPRKASPVKLKVCGMKHNTQEVAALEPHYLGFIFYDKSKRDFGGMEIPEVSSSIKKVGVFVDADLAFAKAHIINHHLDVIQLHGSESAAYVRSLQAAVTAAAPSRFLQWWKVFGIKDQFDFSILAPYEGLVNAFLFDTKGKEKGGNGYTFDWRVLKNYPSSTPIILSGGIGLEEVEEIKEILETDLPIIAVDVNSRFEIAPGKKDIHQLEKFKQTLADLDLLDA